MSYISRCIADGAVGLFTAGDASTVDSATAVDQTGIANGTYGGTFWTGGQTGLIGAPGVDAAKITDNTPGNIGVPDVVGNRTGDTFTYELWMAIAAWPSGTRGLAGVAGLSTLMRFDSSGRFKITQQGVADICTSTASVPADSAFHHLVLAKNGAVGATLILDGVDVSGVFTNETMVGSTGAGYILGRSAADNTPAATYTMFAIYQTPMSLATAIVHYNLGLGIVAPTAATVAGPPPLLGRMGR